MRRTRFSSPRHATHLYSNERGKEDERRARYRKPHDSRVVCKLRLRTRLCFTSRDLWDDSDVGEEMKLREREGKEEKEREIEGRTRGRAVFLHAHPEIYLRCAVRAGKQALRSSTSYFRRDLHTERTCLRFNIRTTLSLSLSQRRGFLHVSFLSASQLHLGVRLRIFMRFFHWCQSITIHQVCKQCERIHGKQHSIYNG